MLFAVWLAPIAAVVCVAGGVFVALRRRRIRRRDEAASVARGGPSNMRGRPDMEVNPHWPGPQPRHRG